MVRGKAEAGPEMKCQKDASRLQRLGSCVPESWFTGWGRGLKDGDVASDGFLKVG